jgi:hypothetical protein
VEDGSDVLGGFFLFIPSLLGGCVPLKRRVSFRLGCCTKERSEPSRSAWTMRCFQQTVECEWFSMDQMALK